MNEVIKQLYERKSVRVFTDREIDESIVDEILTAAAMAPTAGNQQLYTILRITDEDLKRSLSESCDHQPFIAQAPLVLVFCADCRKWYHAFLEYGCDPRKPGVGDLMLAVSDTNIAAQNAVVAAQSLGIGSCYIGDITEHFEKHKQLLSLPQYVVPACMLVMGYPTTQQKERVKPPRFTYDDIVHQNCYDTVKASHMEQMLQNRQNKTEEEFAAWIRAFCKRKWNSEFSTEMSRSVREMLKDWCNK